MNRSQPSALKKEIYKDGIIEGLLRAQAALAEVFKQHIKEAISLHDKTLEEVAYFFAIVTLHRLDHLMEEVQNAYAEDYSL
jgi:hypothetical protein